jgi:hypothetical protein
MASWTHNQCLACWNKEHASGREPVRMRYAGVPRACCFCGQENTDGIFVRHDPSTLPLCKGHNDE